MGHSKSASPQIVRRNALLSAYCTELDQLRDKYGYTCDDDGNWRAGQRVPLIKRKRMVKLLGLIDLLNRGEKSSTFVRWWQSPTLDRWRWRCAWVGLGHTGAVKYRNHASKMAYQIRDEY